MGLVLQGLNNFEQSLMNYQSDTHLILPTIESDLGYQTLLTNPLKELLVYEFFVQNRFPFFNHNPWSIDSAVVFGKTSKIL